MIPGDSGGSSSSKIEHERKTSQPHGGNEEPAAYFREDIEEETFDL